MCTAPMSLGELEFHVIKHQTSVDRCAVHALELGFFSCAEELMTYQLNRSAPRYQGSHSTAY